MGRFTWAWGSLLGAGLVAGLGIGYQELRPHAPFVEQLGVVTGGAMLFIATLAAWMLRSLRHLERRNRDLSSERDKQRRFFESVLRDNAGESIFPSSLGKADAEAGASLSLVQRRSESSQVGRDMIARLSAQLTWIAATAGLQKWLGRTISELNARSVFDVIHPDDAATLKAAFERALRSGEGHDIRCRVLLHSGEERHVQLDVLTRYQGDGKPLHMRCHFLDISARVESDRALRHQTEALSQANERLQRINHELERLKESYRDLYHNAPVLYFSLDPQSQFAACNETMLRTLGYARDDLHDQPYFRVLTPESRERFQEQPDTFQRPGEVEAQWVKKDGSIIDVWIRTVPVLDDAGRFLRSRSVAQDVTERNRLAVALRTKAEELERANEELRRTNRELDDFTYVVSHDLKEPLRTLQAFSNFLAQDYGPQLGSEGQEYIGHLITASKRLGHLIDDLLTLSRAGRVIQTMQTFDLTETINTVSRDLAGLVQRKNAVIRIEGPLPRVVGDQLRIAQLLANLIGNGLKYNQNAKPEVVVTAQPGDGSANGKRPTPEPGLATIYVRDNGIGIDPRYHEQIFGIFRRLHLPEEYEGTGAGLAICKKIVEAHGGQIWVESQPGQGATFCFTLPRPAAGKRDPRTAFRSPGDSNLLTRSKDPVS
jgi:PAS domain S-box-containing protein